MSIQRLVEVGFAPTAILVSILALVAPELFTWMRSGIPTMLGLIMFGMGMTLKLEDIRRVLHMPQWIGLGMFLQFGVMPLAGLCIGMMLGLSDPLIAGLVLVGACPGGTASNVIAYLARANVALSVSMTFVSTVLAPLLTPFLTWLYLHKIVDVNPVSLMWSIAMIVLLPVVGGFCIRLWLRDSVVPVLNVFPLFSTVIIVLVIAIVVALNHARLEAWPLWVMLAVVLHNTTGLLAGYWGCSLLGSGEQECRTISIEVGMQNSGLAITLALVSEGFGESAALPAALFSVWHNISGATIAGWWASRLPAVSPPKDQSSGNS